MNGVHGEKTPVDLRRPAAGTSVRSRPKRAQGDTPGISAALAMAVPAAVPRAHRLRKDDP